MNTLFVIKREISGSKSDRWNKKIKFYYYSKDKKNNDNKIKIWESSSIVHMSRSFNKNLDLKSRFTQNSLHVLV